MKKDRYEMIAEYVMCEQGNFYRLVYSELRNEADALEIVKNAAVRALESNAFTGDAKKLRVWFYRILLEEKQIFLEKNKRNAQAENEVRQDQIYVCRTGKGGERKEIQAEYAGIYEHLEKLPSDLGTIIKLYYFEKMKFPEVAEIMGISVNAAKAKVYRGLRKLGLEMEDEDIWKA